MAIKVVLKDICLIRDFGQISVNSPWSISTYFLVLIFQLETEFSIVFFILSQLKILHLCYHAVSYSAFLFLSLDHKNNNWNRWIRQDWICYIIPFFLPTQFAFKKDHFVFLRRQFVGGYLTARRQSSNSAFESRTPFQGPE